MVLVTGATGHIGNVLVRQLLAQGKKVRALTLPGDDLSPLHGLEVDLAEGDVLDPASLRRAMAGVRQVYHLAGIISILPGAGSALEQVNVQGTRNVLAACRAAGVERLVYTSSIHAIAEAPHGTVIDERQPFDPAQAWGAYDQTKARATLEVLAAAREGLNAVVVCPTGVIGPYDYRQSEMGEVIRNYARRALKFYVDGAYNFVDVRDVAAGHILAAERARAGESYILAGERITIRRLLETVEELAGPAARAPHVNVPFWLAHGAAHFTPYYYRLSGAKPSFTTYALHTLRSNSEISAAKAQQELGYQARALRDSLADTLAWHNAPHQPVAA